MYINFILTRIYTYGLSISIQFQSMEKEKEKVKKLRSIMSVMMDLNPQRSNVIDQEQNNDNENDHDEDLDVGKCNNSSRSLVSGTYGDTSVINR